MRFFSGGFFKVQCQVIEGVCGKISQFGAHMDKGTFAIKKHVKTYTPDSSTISCSETESLLSSFIENELNEGLKKKIQRHLTECDSCEQVYADLKELLKVASSLRDTPMPEGAHKRLKEQICQRTGLSLQGKLAKVIPFRSK